MGLQQVGFVRGVPFLEAVVRLNGVARLDVPKRSRDGLAVEDRADLVLRQAVPLDGERPANGAEPVGAPQPEVLCNRGRLGSAEGFPDLLGPCRGCAK